MGKHYIRFDEIEDVLTSVDLLGLIVPLAKKNPSHWKWIIIGAQNGLQGAMVCLLTGTAGLDVLDKKSAKKVPPERWRRLSDVELTFVLVSG
jgi:hypothetical protein